MFFQEKLRPMYLQHYGFLEGFLCKINNSFEALLFAQIPEITSVLHIGLLQFVLIMKYEWEKRAITFFAIKCVMSITIENSDKLGEIYLEPMKIS